MSTNYYAVISTCPNRDHDELLHIGKSSNGWRFLFRSYPDRKLTTLNKWHNFLIGNAIVNEYGDEIDLFELFDGIERKQHGRKHLGPRVVSRGVADFYDGEFS